MSPASCPRGFTIIETLIAIAVLLLAITAPMTLAERGLASAEAAQQELAVLYLAQEGMEYMRAVRDENFLRGRGGTERWLSGLIDAQQDGCAAESGCGIDLLGPDSAKRVAPCGADNNSCELTQYTNEEGTQKEFLGAYSHHVPNSDWRETGIFRKICITAVSLSFSPGVDPCANSDGTIADAAEVRVAVIARWQAGSLGARRMVLTSILSNWYAE